MTGAILLEMYQADGADRAQAMELAPLVSEEAARLLRMVHRAWTIAGEIETLGRSSYTSCWEMFAEPWEDFGDEMADPVPICVLLRDGLNHWDDIGWTAADTLCTLTLTPQETP